MADGNDHGPHLAQMVDRIDLLPVLQSKGIPVRPPLASAVYVEIPDEEQS